MQRTQLRWIALAGLFFLIPWATLNLAEWVAPTHFTSDNGLIYNTAASFVLTVAPA